MPAVLQRDFGAKRPPKRIKLPSGEVLYPGPVEGSSATAVETSSAASVNELLALGWEVVSGDPGPSGGRVARGSWAAGRAYREGDIVLSGDRTWMRTTTQPSPGSAPPGDGWTEVTVIAGAGSTIRSGTGAPAASFGLDGDYWLDTAASRLYGPKTSNGWGSGYPLGGQGWSFHVRLTTIPGTTSYDLGRQDLPTDERQHMVTLGGIVLSYGDEQDYVFVGSEIRLAEDPGVATNLVIRIH